MLSERTRIRLARLLGMLGSTHDGEVVNAGRMASRVVRASGLSWGDIIKPMPARRASQAIADPQAMARWTLSHGDDFLSAKERDFLSNIQGFRKLSPKQLRWLGDLHERVRGRAG